jgi:transcription-repair coupling factor (superfamily II helicase)
VPQQAGYQSVAQVMEPGEYAVRGGIVDVPDGRTDTIPHRLVRGKS